MKMIATALLATGYMLGAGHGLGVLDEGASAASSDMQKFGRGPVPVNGGGPIYEELLGRGLEIGPACRARLTLSLEDGAYSSCVMPRVPATPPGQPVAVKVG